MSKKKNRVKLNDMINYEATAKQIKYIEDLCKDNGYEFYNKNINMKHAGSIIAFLAKDKVQPHYLFDYIRYDYLLIKAQKTPHWTLRCLEIN